MTPITALPVAPKRTDAPDVFASRADQFLAALPTFSSEANTVAQEIQANHDTVVTKAGEVQANHDTVVTKAGEVSLDADASVAARAGSEAARDAAQAYANSINTGEMVSSIADDTMTGKLTLEKNVGAAATYSGGQLELKCSDNGVASLGFHRAAATACQLRHASNGLILSGTSQTAAADFYSYGNITAYSDKRLKVNIERIDSALEKVKRLGGYTFEKTNEEKLNKGRRHTGVIAQEVRDVLPEAIHEDDDGILSVAYGNMVGLLIEAIKEQQSQIDELRTSVKGG